LSSLVRALSLCHVCRANYLLNSFPTRRSSDLRNWLSAIFWIPGNIATWDYFFSKNSTADSNYFIWTPIKYADDYESRVRTTVPRSEEHTSELQSRFDLVCRLLLEKKKRQCTCR